VLLEALRAHSPEWFPMFAFLLLTGARRGEAAGLRWDDVDLGRRIVTIRRSYAAPTKSGRTRGALNPGRALLGAAEARACSARSLICGFGRRGREVCKSKFVTNLWSWRPLPAR
jgi:integrase